jgi:hypothetical protein
LAGEEQAIVAVSKRTGEVRHQTARRHARDVPGRTRSP